MHPFLTFAGRLVTVCSTYSLVKIVKLAAAETLAESLVASVRIPHLCGKI